MGRAEELFARIRDKGAAEIHAMIAAPFVEELFLDYKQSATPLPSRRLADEDRKNLAKAISGFANSEGGVIVWGVDCRHTPQGDIPSSPVPITDALAFKTLLDGAIGGLTLPAHSGVENIPLIDGIGPSGFVSTHVPVGASVPYRTLYPQQEYYIRAGSNFLPTPHSVLAGLFGRAPQPLVRPVLRYRNTTRLSNVQPQIRIVIEIHVRNDGRGFAEDVFGIVEMKADKRCSFQVPPTEKFDRWRNPNEAQNSFTMRLVDLVLPPGTERNGFELAIDVPSGDVGGISIVVTCGSRGGAASAAQIEMPANIVADVFSQYTAALTDVPTARAIQEHADEQIRACLRQAA